MLDRIVLDLLSLWCVKSLDHFSHYLMSKTRCFRNVLVLFWITVTFAWALEIHKVFFKKKNPGGRGLKAFLHSVVVVRIFFFGRNNPAVYKADCLETLSLVFFFSLHFCALSLAQAGRLAVSLSLSLSQRQEILFRQSGPGCWGPFHKTSVWI